ncbi:MAG: energy transducer TonB [Nitrospirae bacterium]|nr:energy transducer TonB [Nitrospirota bacterium]
MNLKMAQHHGTFSHPAHSWGLSLLVHSLALWVAVVVLGDLKLVPKEEPFRWNVSMVEQPKPEPMAESTPTPVTPAPLKPTSAPATPVVETVATQVVQTVQPIQRVETRAVRQEVQEVRPIEQVVERTVQTIARSVEAVDAQQPTPPAVAHGTPVTAEAPVVAASRSEAVVQASQPVASAAPAPIVTATAIETATASVREVVEPKVVSAPPSAGPSDAPLQPVQEATLRQVPTRSGPVAKADYRWIGNVLGDRIRQLMHYPAKARLNNWEGRVMVRVVIREDGHLHDLEIIQGSGHQLLDEDALEMIRRACPLKMKHALGRPQVTITVPVVYQLNG